MSLTLCASMLAIVLAGCAGTASSDDGSGGDAGGSGGRSGSGGTVGTGGNPVSGSGGAAIATGGSASGGTAAATGGSGVMGAGGVVGTGGRSGSGGAASGGNGSGGRVSASGGAAGATSSGGATAAGGAKGTGGVSASGGATAGATGSAGTSGGAGPCDIYQSAGTPCVAAHSTVRALYAAYGGPLYQVRRSDSTTKDIPALGPGGFADVSVQTSFCSGSKCTISILYDQTSNHNNLVKSPVAHWLTNGGTEADASAGQIMVSGHVVHGIYVTGYSSNVAYRNNATKGVAKGDQAESMYMVVDGKRYSDQCCFDYGNAETTGNDEGNGTMEAVYFGNDITWGGKGQGNGPWVAADLENGVFKCDKGGWQSQSLSVPSAKSITASFAVAVLKGPSGNHYTLKGGDAQSGVLTTMWDGVRPSSGYSPKKLQGAIILGTGGDGSNGGTGTFFEGAMTMGNPSDATDDLIHANIVAAGYGH